ncbi:DUF440 family protein [Alishewanella tabrizica]|uniref:UPF0263 protein n=1 Tax=Alishewanella tabrizica TaxID=671278 RepID=A0ABQ2WQC6_9ALTE|nr:DUF440 family protein [Alishewanella tabrizica]GGW62949.1 UPF0263 protein [Alishewanella tabrizica]
MHELELWSLDELCDHAFDIFEELAVDNLSAADYQLYQQNYETRGYADVVPPGEGWVDLAAQELSPELHVEVQVGLTAEPGAADVVLARILLSRDKEESLCHALWRGQTF